MEADHYAISTDEIGVSEQKTLVIDRHTGDTVRLSGALLNPLFLGDDGLVTTCKHEADCQLRELRTVGYFRLS